eukprot:gnl/MRDRNA2_/MRDRNA2_63428_c0_seq1.p1 gnl/MRDRNA2_/MRDRNA2_63428_c0~~gnl/MRDRNA2_/MRDRNA2_63428_c0_seq1.p1  ORF type:complete len:316 (-),score=54.11 gnl/MRDRNA2_/MRDRNA2_63428_c0_seq1:212-1159(-)
MGTTFVVLLLTCIAPGEAQEPSIKARGHISAGKLTKKVVSDLFERVFNVLPLDTTQLDDTSLGKPTFSISRCSGSVHSRPAEFTRSIGSQNARESRLRHGCGIACCAPCEGEVQSQSITERQLGRRHAGLSALLGLTISRPGFADDKMPQLSSDPTATPPPFTDGPQGMKYRDIYVGEGISPVAGDTVTLNYLVNIASTGKEIDKGFQKFSAGDGAVIKGFDLAVLGLENMKPMNIGSVRQVLVPPELAYGPKGLGCGEGKKSGKCLIPPESTLDLLLLLINVNDEGPRVAAADVKYERAPVASDGLVNIGAGGG